MAGTIAGTLAGAGAIRKDWISKIDQANRCALGSLASNLQNLTQRLRENQLNQETRRNKAFASLLES